MGIANARPGVRRPVGCRSIPRDHRSRKQQEVLSLSDERICRRHRGAQYAHAGRQANTMHRIYVWAFCVLAAGAANAQYKCVGKDGAISFQQQPCPGQSQQQKLEVKVPAPATPAVTPAKAASGPLNVDQRMARDMEHERRIRELKVEITQTEDSISRRNQQMSAELETLRAKKPLARNNLAGATWEQSISQEMQAVTQKYKTMND